MSDGFTKIYREERELLKKINTGAAYEVYMHLKDKYNYFKQDVYDYMGYMVEHLEISERTIIRTIKKLKEVGLIESKRVRAYTNGQPKSINIYSFPIVDKIEGKVKEQDMGMCLGTIEKLENKAIEQQTVIQDVTKEEKQPQNADLNDNFDNYSERLYNLINDNITKIIQSTDILAQKQIEIGSQMDNTVAFHRNVLYNLRKQLGWDTKDGIDFQQFIDEEINRKITEIRYERAI